MQHQRDYFLALRQFAKEVGVPEVLVCHPHPTKMQQKVKEFCTQIGTTLRILEARTQWANRTELYVGLIKEATRKDM
jgi:alpha/beta superfamily hydrolase